ncbi:lycopene beta-cyclase [Sphingomonas jejuensis]|uniref:Lycopene beta-cyclase n=1 Tax=Sphingomonas jejuensis TaxID=904715 RepID=A0ABX0XQW7_9SPHN|nr:lycopene beta-cyclase CrtY [Sphingomonas jejuensis]NJC35091.1 lycopene beta-cyclase [Sphingomonas jejuensis]
MATALSCDLAIVGGGLAGGLAALALRARRPDLDVRLVEPGTIGGNHVWSFFDADLSAAGRALIEGAVTWRWPGYDIAFPDLRRRLDQGYNSVSSDRFAALVDRTLPRGAVVHAAATRLSATGVDLADGGRIEAAGVVDARGAGDLSMLKCGWQKFVGRELRLRHPHGLDRPVVMDATVPQIDGFRFVYLLPFAADRIFVEDTYYSRSPALDPQALSARIDDYAAARGWEVVESTRYESGVLAVVSGGSFDALWGSDGVAKIGVRAGSFHPTTGYSLPDAVRTACWLAAQPDLRGAALHDAARARARASWKAAARYRLLDRMLFDAAPDLQRYRVLQHFYGKDPSVISRFYAGQSTAFDFARILTGRPPVPVGAAIRALVR